MPNARFIFSNAWDRAALAVTKGTTAPALPVQHTQRYNNSRVFRTVGAAQVEIAFDFTNPEFCSGLAVWRHNLTALATYRLELFDEAGRTGDLVYDSGTVPALEPKALGDLAWGLDPLGITVFTDWRLAYSVHWFPMVPFKSGRLTITDTANPAGYIEIGRVYMGAAFEPQVNADLGHVLRWETTTDAQQTAGGTVHTIEGAAYRTLRFNLSHIQPSERAAFMEQIRQVSTHKDFFLSLRPEQGGSVERDYSFSAKFSQLPSATAQAGRYSADLNLREV